MGKETILAVLMCGYSLFASSTNDALKDGRSFGKSSAKQALQEMKEFSVEELYPPKSEEFNSKQARQDLKNQNIQQSEVLEFLTSEEMKNQRNNKKFSEDEYFFRCSEELTNRSATFEIPQEEVSNRYIFVTCQEEGAPYPITVTKTLHVDVVYEPAETSIVKECLGHEKKTHKTYKKDAQKWVEKKLKEFSKDVTLKSYNARVEGGGLFSDYNVKANWTHLNDAKTCDHSREITKVIKPERWEEKGEKWIYDDEALFSLSRSPDCILVDKTCLDSSSKTVNGKEIYKQCWREKYGFLCKHQKSKQCLVLREKACQETARRCLKQSEYGCSLWEVTYKCLESVRRYRNDSSFEGMVGFDESNWEIDYEPNKSFPDVYTKLSFFEEIKKELEHQNIDDARKLAVFKGEKMSCDKNIADSVMYDCCFSLGGLANDLKLSSCSENEITLAEKREHGLCHYVGKYEEDFIDLWKSRDVHVFCCFPSKLARVFQEEARNQLEIGWGKPKNPDCSGFFIEDIERMDLSNMNFSEVYDKKSPELEKKLHERLNAIGPKIKERVDTINKSRKEGEGICQN